jgi:predicted RNA binding protein YcfA (HicA-like mRNA interferase family)
MSHKPVPTKKFIKFLKKMGLEYKRTKGSHDIWDKKDGSLLRPVVFRPQYKDIPPLHIETNLETLGISYKEFEKIMETL